jgi:hypothetical protein
MAMKKPVKVFDLESAVAEATEQGQEDFVFSYGSKEWRLQPPQYADVRALAQTDMGDLQQGLVWLRSLLGEEQWSEFPPINAAGVIALISEYTSTTLGVSPGESEASTDSLTDTPKN